MVQLDAVRGRPNASTGDLATIGLPLENGLTWSTWFEVQAQ